MIVNTNLSSFCSDWLNSWTGNQPDKLISFYHKDALYIDPANKNGLNGQKEIYQYFVKLLRNNPEWKWTKIESYDIINGFILKWKAEIPVSEKQIIEFGLDIVEMKEGKIFRNEVYFDTYAWMKLLQK
jgi:hypothetical protein